MSEHALSDLREPLVTEPRTMAGITDEVCAPMERRPSLLWTLAFLVAVVALGIGVWAVQHTIRKGIGVWGLNKTVGWAFDITNFVFWVGIGHAGTPFSQTETALLRIRARVSSLTNAPPPVASTWGGSSSSRAMTRRSPSRKAASPSSAKISGMVWPAAVSTSVSASTKGMSRAAARRRPMLLLPEPISPTRTMVRRFRAGAALMACHLQDGLERRHPCGISDNAEPAYLRHLTSKESRALLHKAWLIAALALIPAAAVAQEAPPMSAAPFTPTPFEPMPPAEAPPPTPPTPLPPVAGVEVQTLQTLDLFSGGRRDTGLPSELWNGSSADVARDILPTLGTRPLTPAAKALARRLLATAASAPDGAGNDQALAAARAQALLALGDARAARLALERLSAIPSNAALSQAAAESALVLGEDDQACAIAQALTVDRGGPYWLKLRGYCQALAGQADAAALTVSLATAGGKEPAYGRMMAVMLAGSGDPGAASLRSGVDYALSRKMGLNLAPAIANATPAIAAELSAPPMEPGAALSVLTTAKTLDAFTAAAKAAAPALAAQTAAAPGPNTLLLARAALIAGDRQTAQALRAQIAEAPTVDLALLDGALAAASGRVDPQVLDALVERGAAGSQPAQGGALILAALGGGLSPAARAELAGFTTPRGAALPGRLLALDLAAQGGWQGETALLALSIDALAPADRARSVKALAQAGLMDDARALAVEGLIASGLK